MNSLNLTLSILNMLHYILWLKTLMKIRVFNTTLEVKQGLCIPIIFDKNPDNNYNYIKYFKIV